MHTQGANFSLENYLFGTAAKLTKNTNLDKYFYSGYGTEFDACGSLSLSDDSIDSKAQQMI